MATNRDAQLSVGPSYMDLREEAQRVEQEHQVYVEFTMRPLHTMHRFAASGFRLECRITGREQGARKRLQCANAEFSKGGWRTYPAAALWALHAAEERLLEQALPLQQALAAQLGE